jgi:outer membrane protein TolC
MSFLSILPKIILPTSLLFLVSCQMADMAKNPYGVFKSSTNANMNDANIGTDNAISSDVLTLKEAVVEAAPEVNWDKGFAEAVAVAVNSDPKVQITKSEILQQQAKLGVTKSQLDFQFSGTVYAGIEDVTDETNGMAAVLSVSKMMYDGGQILNTISADEYAVQTALEGYRATLDERAFEVSSAWVELERYQSLNALISGRLDILDPLIKQLEQIADAGVGDATQVAAAQRTVSLIRVTQTDIQERLAQAELKFTLFFGELPKNSVFDSSAVARTLPSKVTEKMVMASPGLLSSYAAYLNALKALEVAKARNSITVGFETKVQRPFGQSAYDSDESIGFVVRKTLHNGDRLASEVQSAQAAVDRQAASVKDVYRRGKQVADAAAQSILSMDKAIALARSNARALSDEIALLRQQLVIGQSTLDSVLSAEARLYDAESQEIHFRADKQTAQLSLLSAIGRLSPMIGINPAEVLN